MAFWAFLAFHFGLLGLHLLSFWALGPSFPFILAFWAFISFHFSLLALDFLSFWPFEPYFLSFWLVWAATWGPPHKLPKMARFLNVPHKEFNSARSGYIFQFLAFWTFIFFHFGLLGLHFLSF